MQYFRKAFLALVTAAACVSVPPAYGQNNEEETDEDVSVEQEATAVEEIQDNDDEEAGFTPTEKINVDSAISFPVDI